MLRRSFLKARDWVMKTLDPPIVDWPEKFATWVDCTGHPGWGDDQSLTSHVSEAEALEWAQSEGWTGLLSANTTSHVKFKIFLTARAALYCQRRGWTPC